MTPRRHRHRDVLAFLFGWIIWPWLILEVVGHMIAGLRRREPDGGGE